MSGIPAAFQRHGGRLAAAAAWLPGRHKSWVDLSTGINPIPYRVRRPSLAARSRLPEPEQVAALENAAAAAFGITAPGRIAAVPGSEAGLRLLPRLLNGRSVAIAGPTYASHGDAWRAAGHIVSEVPFASFGQAQADILIIVNPNNPDGQSLSAQTLLDIAARQEQSGGWLVVDEAFAETTPETAIAARAQKRLVVLRSFGKFYGLPGVRLGFICAASAVIAGVRDAFGDWPVSADAIVAGLAAYPDRTWADRTRQRLARDAARLDRALSHAGLTPIGGTSLFRLAKCRDASACFAHLLESGILTRIFDYDSGLIRIGLPRGRAEWIRLETALRKFAQ